MNFENLKNPVIISEAIRQIVLMLILFEAIHWTEAQTIGFLSAISAVLAVFIKGSTVAATQIEQRVEEKVAHRELAGTTGTGAGLTPSATPGPATPGVKPPDVR